MVRTLFFKPLYFVGLTDSLSFFSLLCSVPPVMNTAMNMSSPNAFRRSAECKHSEFKSSAAASAAFDSLFDNDYQRNIRSSPAQMKSVDLSSHDPFSTSTAIPASSGLQSPLSFFGSRRSFQTISNFIPKAWASPAPVNPPQPSASHHINSVSDQTVVPEHPSQVEPIGPRYVSRETQLRKLLLRLEVEGKAQMSYAADVDCRNCTTALVHI